MLCNQCNKNPRKKYGKKCNTCYKRNFRKNNPNYDARYRYGGNRKNALLRDDFICQSCGKNKNEVKRLEVHHIDGNGSTKQTKQQNNSLKNLITLCIKCHKKIELIRKPRKSPGLGSRLKGRWAIYYDKCISCSTKEKKHIIKGLCSTCFEKTRKEYKAKWFKNRT